MKVALLHYWLTNMRGGENVLAEFCRLYPTADIFTHAWNPQSVTVPFSGHHIQESFVGKLPGARKNCQKYLPLMPSAMQRWDFSGYDLLLSSESGPVKGIRKPENTVHICYCHTPMRYLWDMYEDYYHNTGMVGKIAMTMFKYYLRNYDLKSASCVDYFIANSNFVRERIERIYHRDAIVIYPPVDFDFYHAGNYSVRDYYLFVGQLIPYKRADLAVAACRKLRRKLVVIGSGPMKDELQQSTDDCVVFAGRISNQEMRQYYAEARALIFPGIEDFGIVPLEAQAAGAPVIALGIGGALETVKENETGLFFPEATVESLMDAILRFEAGTWNREICGAQAALFSPAVFRRKISDFILASIKR